MDAIAPHLPAGASYQIERGLRILVIDDDDCVSAAIQTILNHRNADAVVAARAYDGIQAFESSAFDVVMIDLFMPGMNGLDAIAHIRRDSAIPIIAMSGFRLRNTLNPTDYRSMAMARGASVFLRKPFTSGELIESIERTTTRADSPERLTQ